MVRTLIIGYGNPDREDDGVAWHVVSQLAERLGRSDAVLDIVPESTVAASLEPTRSPDLLCLLQLTPEIAEVVARYDRVCFVDAHTGAWPEGIRFQPVDADYRSSPFTHHLTPETCLLMAETLFGHRPAAHALSIRGYQFGFSQQLSSLTEALATVAVDEILDWLDSAGEERGGVVLCTLDVWG